VTSKLSWVFAGVSINDECKQCNQRHGKGRGRERGRGERVANMDDGIKPAETSAPPATAATAAEELPHLGQEFSTFEIYSACIDAKEVVPTSKLELFPDQIS